MSARTEPTSSNPESSRQRLLVLLKTKGPMTAAQLARRLGVTSVAVHQHLSAMLEEGLVEFTKDRSRVGRPAHLWRLTSKADGWFPDGHADLAIGLLEAMRRVGGERALTRIIRERARQQSERYAKRMPRAGAPLRRRVAALARMLRGDGYLAQWGSGCDGEIELTQNHCTVSNAARVCPQLCDIELRTFRTVLGDDVRVTRIEHLLGGDPRCAYRIGKIGRRT